MTNTISIPTVGLILLVGAPLTVAGCAPTTAEESEERLVAIPVDDLPAAPRGRHTTEQPERGQLPEGAAPAEAETPAPGALVVDRTEVYSLTSGINGVTYEIRVSLPHGYASGDRRFPVVYALDADYSFLVARGITDHLSERDHLPEVLVVGIGYRDQEEGRNLTYRRNRTRDYTPTFVADGGYGPEIQKVSGGGPRFLEAIEDEVIPFVEGRYRTVPADRTLVGHSYGGLFALWTLFERPGLFRRYVAVSPSLWYDDGLIFRLEERYAASREALAGRLYLCAGSRENPVMPRDLRKLADRLEGRSYGGLSFRSLVMENETHNSIFPGCLSNGLRYVLEGT